MTNMSFEREFIESVPKKSPRARGDENKQVFL